MSVLFQSVPKGREFPRLQKAAYALLLFLCVFIPLRSPLADLTTSAVKAIPDVLIAALLLAYLIAARLRVRWRPQDGIFLAFLLVALVSTCVVNGYSVTRYIYQLRSIGLYYVLYFVLRDVRLNRTQLIRVVQTLQGMAFVLLIFGAIEKVSFKLIAFSYETAASIYSPDNYARVYSLFYNPNTYGAFLVFVLLLSVVKHRYWGSKTSPLIYAMLVAQLYLSMSRSSILILVLGLLLLVFLECREHRIRQCIRPYAKNVAACVLCTVILSSALSAGNQWFYNTYLTEADGKYALLLQSMEFSMKDRFGELGQAYMYDNATNLRIFFFQMGLKVWQDNPVVGTGFGTFGTSASLHYGSSLYAQYGLADNFYADDEYITILVETGALGAALFGLFLISILIYYRKSPIKLFVCVMFGWFGIFFNIFEIQIAAMLFWSILAIDNRLLLQPAA